MLYADRGVGVVWIYGVGPVARHVDRAPIPARERIVCHLIFVATVSLVVGLMGKGV